MIIGEIQNNKKTVVRDTDGLNLGSKIMTH